MSSMILSGDTSGTVTVTVPAVAGTNTITLPAVTGTAVVAGQNSAITAATAQASTSGTSIDFTSIPSWVKRITVMFNGVSTNGASSITMQLGTSGGYTTSGYNAAYVTFAGSALAAGNFSTGFPIANYAASAQSGALTLSLLGSNTWCATGSFSMTATNYFDLSSGSIALSGTLDRLRIIGSNTGSPVDTFDAGSINILYE